MKVGVQFPNESFVSEPSAVRDFAQTAEGLGYSHLLVYEHVLGAEHVRRDPPLTVPYNESTVFHEPMVLFGYLAAVTTSIELASGILVLPQRQTALVAKQAAEVAYLSGDRLRLGVGVGWNHVEYLGLGADHSNRGIRSEEQIEVLRQLWERPVVDFNGRWHRIDRAGISPRPRTRIPIWMGGFSDAAYRRAARLADGFIYSLHGPQGPDPDPRGTIERLRTAVAEAGRDPADFGIEMLAPLPLTPREFADLVSTWHDTAVTHLTLHLFGGSTTPKEHIAALRDYRNELGS
ncbi:LLM class F420-dependent oxidoreductase [Frankia gtarii]|uniref:LLM class F420-dependent oxidoreductase n=1 Tax=Frankia gtarii TaxID=2950102 RepID=UPI0021C2219C|nr:LLM class F420-dependent oxidoreductase [Frankia gtarii]